MEKFSGVQEEQVISIYFAFHSLFLILLVISVLPVVQSLATLLCIRHH